MPAICPCWANAFPVVHRSTATIKVAAQGSWHRLLSSSWVEGPRFVSIICERSKNCYVIVPLSPIEWRCQDRWGLMGVLIRSLFFCVGRVCRARRAPGSLPHKGFLPTESSTATVLEGTFGDEGVRSDLPWTEWAARSPIGIAPFALSRIMWRQR